VQDLYQPNLDLPEPERQTVGEMDEIQSRSYTAAAGFSALQGFLVALGVPALPLQATIKAARESAVSLSFSIGGVSRSALLPGQIKREMKRRGESANWGSVDPQCRYLVAHAVWEATSLEVKLTGKTETTGDLAASLTKVAKASVDLREVNCTAGTVSYDRHEPIAFGIQVAAVQFDTGIPQLEGAPEPTFKQVRREGAETTEAPDETSGVLIGAQGGSPFVTLR
jgi:hypothetical protein